MEQPVSTPQDFKAKSNRMAILTLPSGATIKVKNPGGLRMFMKNGVIPNSLLPMVEEAINGGTEPDLKALSKDGEISLDIVQDMMSLIDHVTVTCWVLPPVLPVPENEEDRDEELLYADEVMDDDKLFVFQWVTGGTKDLERFRQEQAVALDGMARVPDVEATTQ